MKRFAMTLMATVLTIAATFAQAPEGVNYQAVARDGNGSVMSNQALDVRFSVREGNPGGNIVYEETHATATNDFGLFTLIIGAGNPNSGLFSDVEWGTNSFFLQVEVDAGNGYVDLGTTQMMSVPYALYAKEAGNSGKDYVAGSGIDITNETISNTGDLDPSDDMLKGDAAGGDLSGTYPNPTVSHIQGMPVSAQAPSVGDVLVWNGSEWIPDTVSGQGGGGTLWTKNGNDVYYDLGMVGINNPAPDQELDVEGTFQLSNTGTSYNQATNNADESYSLTIDGDSINSFYVNKRRYATLFGDNVPVTGLSAFDVNAHTGINSYGGMYVNHESATGKPFYGYAAGGSPKAWTYWDPNTEQFRVNNGGDHLVVTKNGSVGIGRPNPLRALEVEGRIQVANQTDVFDFAVNNDGKLEIIPNGATNPAFTIDDDDEYVGVFGSVPVTSNSTFDIHSDATGMNYGGMFVNTNSTDAKPFYGYSTDGTAKAWSYYDGVSGNWSLHNGGNRLSITDQGKIGMGTTNPEASLHIKDNGAGFFGQNNVLIESTNPNDSRTLLEFQVDGSANDYRQVLTIKQGIIQTFSLDVDGSGRFSELETWKQTSNPGAKKLYGNSLPLAYGRISSSGSAGNTKYGIGNVAKINTGTYTITLLNPSEWSPAVMITPYDASGGEIANYSYDTNTKTITVTITGHNGSKTDSDFSIVVFGFNEY